MMTREQAALEVTRREAALQQQREAEANVPYGIPIAPDAAKKVARRRRRAAARGATPLLPFAGDELSPVQQAFLTALLGTPIPTAAARAAGIDPSTGAQYLKQPAFAKAYREALAAHQEAARQRLAVLTGTAVERLEWLLVSDDAAIVLKAVETALKWGLSSKADASREGPQQLRITEIVVQLPQAAGDGSRNDTGTTHDSRLTTTAPVIQGELGAGLGVEPEATVESPAAQPDSAWGSLQVVVQGEGE